QISSVHTLWSSQSGVMTHPLFTQALLVHGLPSLQSESCVQLIGTSGAALARVMLAGPPAFRCTGVGTLSKLTLGATTLLSDPTSSKNQTPTGTLVIDPPNTRLPAPSMNMPCFPIVSMVLPKSASWPPNIATASSLMLSIALPLMLVRLPMTKTPV